MRSIQVRTSLKTSRLRPIGPLFNSRDRQVVVNGPKIDRGPKDRHDHIGPPGLGVTLWWLLPRPDGRGYFITALRACKYARR